MLDHCSNGSSGGKRPNCSDPLLDRAEAEWWRDNNEVEHRFCWVQTPEIQRFLRGRYVRQLRDAIPRDAAVLEYGCGSGWLSLQLAQAGVRRVVGVDTCVGQIERAVEEAGRSGHSDRLRFEVLSSTDRAPGELLRHGPFDCIVCHGVLHHLSDVEIQALLEQFRQIGGPGVSVFIMEPVQEQPSAKTPTLLDRALDFLILLPRRGEAMGLRKVSPEEARIRDWVDQRGASPKEAPFQPGELEALIGAAAELRSRRPVLIFSYLVAKNLLLMGLTYPRSMKLCGWPLLFLSRALERLLLRVGWFPTSLPVFQQWEYRIR